MKRVVRIIGSLVLLVVVILVVAMVFSTAKGYTIWYFRVNGSVMVDGRETSGYMHANTHRDILLITRTDGSRPETYLVPVASGKPVLDCGKWHPIRFLPTPIGDLNPPCSVLNEESESAVDPPVASSLVRSGRSVEFSTASGKSVKAEW